MSVPGHVRGLNVAVEWLTTADLAAELGVPLSTVYYWNHTSTGPPYHRFGRHVRYRRDDVERWYATQRVE